ncbi:hypothetical protein HJC23_011949 [Cyclotella cryptica]|uniref:Uncharacterized protein n=1 Tax=Cyclotella cryptica TaxID=29204 RepID=A0ABD3QQW8_9STRA|eukprot:CCRYP_002988-RA/>CCRYP_002988-RA protein AED:0.00 eAED:0.00 QI:302/-1/1/1/-1/1/1/134/497
MTLFTKGKRAISAGALSLLAATAILTADDELKELRDFIYRRNLGDEISGDVTNRAMSALEVFRTGIIVGTLYVLTGPNLAAIATLSGTDVIDHCNDDAKKNRRDGTLLIGIRWGIGNSIGLLLVGGLLIWLQSLSTIEWAQMDFWISYILQALVGVFSIILGAYGLVKALKNRQYSSKATDLEFVPRVRSYDPRRRDSVSSVGIDSVITEVFVNTRALDRFDDTDGLSLQSDNSPTISRADSIVGQMVACLNADKDCDDDDNASEEDIGLTDFERKMWRTAKVLSESVRMDDEWSINLNSLDGSMRTVKMSDKCVIDRDIVDDDIVLTKQDDAEVPTAGAVKRTEEITEPKISFTYLCTTSTFGKCFVCTPGMIAVFIGVVHGVTGPGGVLGSIPAFQLQHAPLAILYLGTFCVTSTLVMGGFAAVYGRLCVWLAGSSHEKDEDSALSKVFLVEFGSACVSIVVGIVWLTLLAVGQLDVSLLMIGESTLQAKVVFSE